MSGGDLFWAGMAAPSVLAAVALPLLTVALLWTLKTAHLRRHNHRGPAAEGAPMGRPDVNCEPPRIVSLVLGVALYGLAWGQDPGSGDGWHSATDRDVPGERLTASQLADIFAAAALGEAQLDTALSLGPTARAWSKAKLRADAAVQGGAAALLTACRARYAGWQGAPLTSPWVTA